MPYPVFIFDGPDGTGKTTQSLILGQYLRAERPRLPLVYVSLPYYISFFGRTIGRCLHRWEGEQIDLPAPEDMAVLFSLNRLEILPTLLSLINREYLIIFNRGPYANLFNVARRALDDGVDWSQLGSAEKTRRINEILALDRTFLEAIQREREMVNIFLLLDPQISMGLAEQKARSTLGGLPDRHESSFELQDLAARIYREIAEGQMPGHEAELVEAQSGSFRRAWEVLAHNV